MPTTTKTTTATPLLLTLLLAVHAPAPCAGAAAALTLSTKALREYELKHARVAMAAASTLTAMTALGVEEPVKWLSQQPVDVQLTAFSTAAVLEAAATLPRFTGLLDLRDEIEPGVFPPLRAPPPESGLPLAELLVGRSAMLSTFAWLVATAT